LETLSRFVAKFTSLIVAMLSCFERVRHKGLHLSSRLRLRNQGDGDNQEGTRSPMANADSPAPNPSSERSWLATMLHGTPHLESFSQSASNFVSGPWGTVALFAFLTAWVFAIPFVGWSKAYQTFEQFITVASFILLFLIQRSQIKDTLSLQVKLNELLAAAHRASPELINVEDRSESEVREIHDRFQEIQQRGPGAHSIADLDSRESAGPIP
jgi:low affinity Fe/Cu permease